MGFFDNTYWTMIPHSGKHHHPYPWQTSCATCNGEGWDTNSGGGIYLCPVCKGTGCIPNRKCEKCGHRLKEHYIYGGCNHGVINLFWFFIWLGGKHRLQISKGYIHDNRPCRCEKGHYQEEAGETK